MKTAFKTTAVAALASIMAITGMVPAQAQVIRPVAPIASTTDATTVQYRDRYERRIDRRIAAVKIVACGLSLGLKQAVIIDDIQCLAGKDIAVIKLNAVDDFLTSSGSRRQNDVQHEQAECDGGRGRHFASGTDQRGFGHYCAPDCHRQG